MSSHKPPSRRAFLRLALVGSGASLALAACGQSSSQPGSTAVPATEAAAAPTPAANAAATTAPSVAKTVEITHWDWWVTQAPWVDEEIRLFESENPGIKIKKVTNVDKYEDLLVTAFRDTAPDTYLLPSAPGLNEFVNNGWILPLSDFADFDAFAATYPSPDFDFIEGKNRFADKTYSAPFASRGNMWNQLYINTKVFKDAGLVDAAGNAKLPATLDDMLAAARTIKETSKGAVYGYGNALTSWTPGLVFYLGQLSGANAASGGLDWRTGKHTFSTNPVFKRVATAFKAMREEDLILPDSASVDDESIRALFAQHKFAMLIAGTWVINGWQQTHPDFTEYALVPMPLVDTATPSSYYYASPGGQLMGINAKTANSEAAWAWFKWLHSRPAAERFVKSGNGLVYWSDLNKPEYATNDAMKAYIAYNDSYTRIDPQPTIRNPELSKLQIGSVNPDEGAIIQGIYTGQITDIDAALSELAAAKDAALAQAFADAAAAGAKVSPEDYIFPDWDPTKDYVTKRA